MSEYDEDEVRRDQFDNRMNRTNDLPCGAHGVWDGCGLRCTTCFAIWGSIGCACSNELRARAADTTRGGETE